MPIEYKFCFIYSEQCIKIISLRKKCGLFSSVFKQIIPNKTTPTFQEELNPSNFVDGIRTYHGIALTITELNDFYSQGILLFCLPLFSIEMNQKVNS